MQLELRVNSDVDEIEWKIFGCEWEENIFQSYKIDRIVKVIRGFRGS